MEQTMQGEEIYEEDFYPVETACGETILVGYVNNMPLHVRAESLSECGA